jgi:hypothetical protein
MGLKVSGDEVTGEVSLGTASLVTREILVFRSEDVSRDISPDTPAHRLDVPQ